MTDTTKAMPSPSAPVDNLLASELFPRVELDVQTNICMRSRQQTVDKEAVEV